MANLDLVIAKTALKAELKKKEESPKQSNEVSKVTANKVKKSKKAEGDDHVQATMATARADTDKARLISTAKIDANTAPKARNKVQAK